MTTDIPSYAILETDAHLNYLANIRQKEEVNFHYLWEEKVFPLDSLREWFMSHGEIIEG